MPDPKELTGVYQTAVEMSDGDIFGDIGTEGDFDRWKHMKDVLGRFLRESGIDTDPLEDEAITCVFSPAGSCVCSGLCKNNGFGADGSDDDLCGLCGAERAHSSHESPEQADCEGEDGKGCPCPEDHHAFVEPE